MKKFLHFVSKFIKLGGKHFVIPTVACCLAIVVSFHYGLVLINNQCDHEIVEIDSCAINRQFVAQQLESEVSKYIEEYAPTSSMTSEAIVSKCLVKDYPISLLLAQAHIESHFGTKGRATKTNSVFGIGAYDDGTSKSFYESPDAAIDSYLDLMINYYLKDNPPLEVLKRGLTRGQYRYASDPDYEWKLIRKMNQINSEYHIEKLQEIYNLLK